MQLKSVEKTFYFDNFETGATDTIEVTTKDGLVLEVRTSRGVTPDQLSEAVAAVAELESTSRT